MPQAALLWMRVTTGSRQRRAVSSSLQREAEGAVARDVEHRPARLLQLQRQRVGQAEAEVAHAGLVEARAHVVHRREVVAPEGGVAAVVDRQRIGAAARARSPAPARRDASPPCARRPSRPACPRSCARTARALPASRLHRRAARCRRQAPPAGPAARAPRRPASPPRAAPGWPERRRIDVDVDRAGAGAARSGPAASHIHDDQRQPTLRITSARSKAARTALARDQAAMADEVRAVAGAPRPAPSASAPPAPAAAARVSRTASARRWPPRRRRRRSAAASRARSNAAASLHRRGCRARSRRWRDNAPARGRTRRPRTRTSAASTSCGMSRCTGPGRPDSASRKARRTSSGMRRASCTTAFHLVIGRAPPACPGP